MITLPPLPQLLAKFLLLAEDEQPRLPELAALISLDAAFTAQILTVSSTCLRALTADLAGINRDN